MSYWSRSWPDSGSARMDKAKDERRTRLTRPWRWWILGLIAVAVVRIVLTAAVFPQFYDEPVHILCGLEWLGDGTYTIEEQHPPLARAAVAIGPYLAGLTAPAGADNANMWRVSNRVLDESADYLRTLLLARLGILPFFVVACLMVAVWAKRWFSAAGAIFSTVLLTTTPTVLAHAALATTDMASAATVLLALGSLFAVIARPAFKTAVIAGCCIALALLAKFSSIPFLAVCIPVMLFFRWLLGPQMPWRSGTDWRRVSQLTLVAIAVCGLTVWAGVRFSIGPLLLESDTATKGFPFPSIPKITGLSQDRVIEILEAPVYPAGEIFRGVLEVHEHNHSGHRSYLLGEIGKHGWWYFFPVAFGVKTPIPFLLLGLVSLGMLFVTGVRQRDWRLPALVGCAVAIMAIAMTARLNLGVRHILVLYPLLALAAASLGGAALRSKAVMTTVVVLLGWQSVESLRAHPDYLPYFNQIAGDHPEDFLVGSDLDWGQDLLRLEQTVRELKIEKLHIAYSGSAEPEFFDFPELANLADDDRPTGWVAVSLTGLKLYPARYGWLESYEPYTLVGKSIRLYRIPEEQP